MSSNERITRYLDRLCCHIRWPLYRIRIRRELTDHILSRAEYLHKERGFDTEEAVAQAILQLGDPDELGHSLCRLRRSSSHLLCLMISILLWSGIAFCILYLLLRLFG